jgi:hypothetical protein
MKKLNFIITLLLIVNYNVKGQNSFETQITTGWMFHDYIGQSEDVLKFYKGYGIHSNFNIGFYRKINQVDIGLGLGYCNVHYLIGEVDNSSYSTIKFEGRLKSKLSRLTYTAAVNNHILLHREKQDLQKFQRRIFTNIDLGINYKINDKISFLVNSPITILPLFTIPNNIKWGYLYQGSIRFVDIWVETIGVNVGFIYHFDSF